jgi:hypothetical protein
LLQLLRLASPGLPIGGFSYSQGLESALELGLVRDAASAQQWLHDVLQGPVCQFDAAMLAQMLQAVADGDEAACTGSTSAIWPAAIAASKDRKPYKWATRCASCWRVCRKGSPCAGRMAWPWRNLPARRLGAGGQCAGHCPPRSGNGAAVELAGKPGDGAAQGHAHGPERGPAIAVSLAAHTGRCGGAAISLPVAQLSNFAPA